MPLVISLMAIGDVSDGAGGSVSPIFWVYRWIAHR